MVIMNNQEVVVMLQECKQMLQVLASEVSEPTEEKKNDYQRCEASLPEDLRMLIQEAKEMKWPFVPERWQYKRTVSPEDKTNLQDLINLRLHDILVFLKACILVHDSCTAAAIVFLIDRFLYWADASTRLLSVAKVLHKIWPSTPIAPQVVIRQARISVNSGKLLKAEYILSSLISNNGATGTWNYYIESDRLLVQSVCIQIRGQILQKLGMWYEAAELIWTSIVGYFELHLPDKKGIARSLGILAEIFISMSEEDYQRFKQSSHMGLTLLEEYEHRLLSAAEACKLAATFSLYSPLFVLTNLNIRGACLLSYSLSEQCPIEKRSYYLSEAKESFHIGLLTKKTGDNIISKQELHGFVRAAFCLVNVHKWLKQPVKEEVDQLCMEAMEKLAKYNMLPDKQDKVDLSMDIMSLVSAIKEHLDVKPFKSSEENCYVPDIYKECIEKNIVTRNVSFTELLHTYSQHHNSVCEVFDVTCKQNVMTDGRGSGVCVTALKTSDTVTTIDNPSSYTNEKSDRLGKRSKRGKLARSNAVSCDGNREKSSRSFNSSQSSSLSNSSFSWEYIHELKAEEEEEYGNAEKVDSSCSSDNPVKYIHGDEESNKIKLRGLSLQEKKVHDDQSTYSSHKKPEILFSSDNCVPSSKSGQAGNTLSKATDIENVVPAASHNAETVHSSDDEDFEVVGHFSETLPSHNIRIPSTGADNDGVYNTGSFISNKGHIVMHGIDMQAETVDTTDTVHGTFKNDLISTGPSNSPRGNTQIYGVDIKAETEDGTDNVFTRLHEDNFIHPDALRCHAENIKAEIEDTRSNRMHGSQKENHYFTGDIVGEVFSLGAEGETETNVDTNDELRISENTPNSLVPVGGNIEQKMIHTTVMKSKDNADNSHSQIKVSVPNLMGQCTSPITHDTSEEKMLSTEDKLEKQFLHQQCSVETSNQRSSLTHWDSRLHMSSSTNDHKQLLNNVDPCESTEEGDDKLSLSAFSSSHGSSSWSRISQFSRSLSESNSLISSSASSFGILSGLSTEHIQQACSLDDTDYEKLLSGVSHSWLLKRLENTGVFSFKESQKTHNALLLKFSKKSELWTAQETVVHIGKHVDVGKKGKQRNAFWVYFLHQDETLGRYIGKAYKKHKELLYHFCDVERQMTAQYYVTEFNKRLYGLNIPTQIFFVPSAVLLIMEGRTIKECMSVEPYILGDFVKLSNNTKIVKPEFEATKYGLAFGHFTYEYFSDIVVDLQGWVTGSEKGEAIIYLTDPQIHSMESTPGATHINFEKYGIYMFFTYQHKECNNICKRLSLTRPDARILAEFGKTRKKKDY
ncbi:hypothetical protein GDO81_000676 [Engystomops pustulosus]|uniref:Alpha-type protein kinase domain-containing protein n=3 Tax=Engystomops pustulosus TaxID=76066 RepID=A0AAV7D6W7_ENGPU|nr:hypothetical protein GDO81_000676 [Engystomops pustulosus]KAG8592931.1 hypothetical protein GDO81_000676 [Engystomops pustulosus]KAG8592932.1 hypothetical protein GDO81_000676 [Engystomops pustulosus]